MTNTDLPARIDALLTATAGHTPGPWLTQDDYGRLTVNVDAHPYHEIARLPNASDPTEPDRDILDWKEQLRNRNALANFPELRAALVDAQAHMAQQDEALAAAQAETARLRDALARAQHELNCGAMMGAGRAALLKAHGTVTDALMDGPQ